jgi:hypothetical protein
MSAKWQFKSAMSAFPSAGDDWDALNRAHTNHILLDSGFVAPLLRHFGHSDVMLAAGTNGAMPGMALLERSGIGRWETFQPSQAPIGLIELGRLDPSGEDLLQMARVLPGYALQLSVLQQDPDCTCFPLADGGKQFQYVDYIRTARITLTGTFDEYWKRRGTNLRHNLARRRRRLGEQGLALELVVYEKPSDVSAAIRDYGFLETRSWKASEGTAVSEDNDQGRFYREVFEFFCERGEGRIYQLRLNGKVAATDLCLLRGGMIVILKTTYDEAFQDFSPAFLMREEMLRRLFEDPQVHTVEFYGRVMDWHTRWTDEIRTIYHINCFRYPWVPVLKKLVGRFG